MSIYFNYSNWKIKNNTSHHVKYFISRNFARIKNGEIFSFSIVRFSRSKKNEKWISYISFLVIFFFSFRQLSLIVVWFVCLQLFRISSVFFIWWFFLINVLVISKKSFAFFIFYFASRSEENLKFFKIENQSAPKASKNEKKSVN